MKAWRRALVALLLALPALGGAHEGHEHDAADGGAAPASPSVERPRLALESARVELVAVREDGGLRIYVDDYASNAPLAGLVLAVSSSAQSWKAQEIEPGTYALAAGLLPAGALPLRFALRGEGWEETLDGRLPAAPAVEARAGPRVRPAWAVAAVVAAILLVPAGLLLRRRRRAA